MKKIVIGGIVALFLFILFYLVPWYLFITKTLQVSFIKTFFSSGEIKKMNNHIAILILGIAGGTHEGPNLSDSITVITYNPQTNRITTLGIPRDIWSETLKDKINSAYAYGEAKEEDTGGAQLAKTTIEEIVGFPIQYVAIIDFKKFESFIDDLGGIEVDVERLFTDKDFPIEGKENDLCGDDPEYRCRYQTISFEKGLQYMDGKTALVFARSRHAQGEEGTDFARNKRQQKIISAVKEKVVKVLQGGNVRKIKNLYEKTNRLIARDISNQELVYLIKQIIWNKYPLSQKSFSLSENLFYTPPFYQYDGRYVLLPKENSFNRIHTLIACYREKGEEDLCRLEQK